MATIYFSVMGEGRGHAARARSMVERLRGEHRMVLFTSHDALAFLSKEYADDPEVEVVEIPGLRFCYTEKKLALLRTIREGLALWVRLGRHTSTLEKRLRSDRPDLVVADFEPLMPRAARRVGVPVLSLDHQHFMTTYDLSSLPLRLRWWAWAMSWAVWMFGIGQEKTVVSAFYKPPLRRGCENVTQVGPLLRPALRDRTPTRGEHLLTYLRKATPPRILDMLEGLDTPVRVYGLGPRAPRGKLTFCEISESGFLDDLAGCDAVIAAAGNQLLGEALYFGKPFFALPEQKHHEQCINAHFLKQMGYGDWRAIERVGADDFAAFMQNREGFRANFANKTESFDGTEEAAAAIDAMLFSPRSMTGD
ncbi:hypothetical protein Mal64_38760 [Pseudobythopirellula maris]|uniref:MurG-like transferase n=1 Tax=Pseudobythopirellula maris TaxID=2527991 RepID=A0A5C5ZGU3_9BACT|nr:glycosyltransferase family protein [Pseudobythopirellula maris]TWT86335.1 hypothetical protein Mal64_38760 [Pseudobythopirellula maris]